MNKKILFSYLIGTALEIYEFTIFGLMAGILAKHFFSEYEINFQMQLIFIMFAIGFIVRPIGALFYGAWGDTKGRRSPFLSAIVLMAIATFMMGLLPTYEMIGWTSTLLLLILRVVQGIAVSGEFPGALTLLYEQASHQQIKIYTSLSMASTFLGMLLASMTVVMLNEIMGEQTLKEWGWRLPFLFACLLGGIAVWLRKTMEESSQFLRLKRENKIQKTTIRTLFKKYKYSIIVMIAIYQLSVIISYTAFIYFPNIRVLSFADDFTKVYTITSFNLIMITVLIPFFSYYFNENKLIPIMAASALLACFSVFLLFKWTSQPGWIYFFAAQGVLSIVGASFVSCFPYLLAQTFPTSVRYSGNAIVLNVTSGCFGGMTPYLLSIISEKTGSTVMPAIYIVIAAILSLTGLMYLKYKNYQKTSL